MKLNNTPHFSIATILICIITSNIISAIAQDQGFDITPFLTGTQTGDASFFDPGLSACGVVLHDTDIITAINFQIFDNFP
ncbi:hypothetical protein CVT24_000804 [Panaeolus cyanescens]|uniref:Uncharacterized protein n=1 Tax=Panaeolus cyanescens TaxID=181874 RepID=A0A409WPI1_9AGAR|nr:hypothetical protein CVT24_000804 [Panaeolus cyanescens]